MSRYRLTLKWKIQKKLLIPSDTLFTTKEYQNIIVELFTMFLSPIPGIQDIYIPEYYPDWSNPATKQIQEHGRLDLNTTRVPLYINKILLAAAMILRMQLLIRFLITFTRFRSARQQRLCLYSNDQEADFMFAIKAVKEDSPYTFVSFALVVPLLALAYCTRIFERPLMEVSGQNFDSMSNCMWYVIVTMATVGYGDYWPLSYLGRIVGMLSCFWGVFTLSTMVVILNNLLEFDEGERKSFDLLMKMKCKDELKACTVNVIISAQKHKFERSRDEIDYNKLSTAYTMFRKSIFELKRAAKRVQAMRGNENDVDSFTRDLGDIHKEVDKVRKQQ